MRAHAAAQFTLTHFGAWRWAVLALSVLVAMLAVAWVAASGSPARSWPWPVSVAGLALLGAWLVAVQPRLRPVTLAWDGQGWQLAAATGQAHTAAVAGDLSVAIDLGAWMLLRFDPAGPSAGRRPRWIPAQRAGHAGQWHALRCAVYSPRPDAGVDVAPDV